MIRHFTKRRQTRGMSRVVPVVVALGLVLAACGSTEPSDTTLAEPGDTTTAAASPGTTQTTGASSEPRVFRIAFPTIVSNIDPAVYEGTPTTENEVLWSAPLYEFVDPEGLSADQRGLTGIDSTRGLLVESDVEEENGSLVITLRDNVVSPYGNKLTSEDVRWTFERVVASDFVGRFVMSVAAIDQENPIEIIDDRTFRLNVTEPNPYVRAALTLWDLSPLDSTEVLSHATGDDPYAAAWLSEHSATFGAYTVGSFTPGEQIVLEANPNWFGESPAFARVVMQKVADAGSRLQLLTTGEIDYAHGLLPDQFQAIETDGSVSGVTRLSNTFVMLEMNFSFEPFQDPRVRRAIAMAIDRQAIVDGVMRGYAGQLGIQVPPALQQPTPPGSYPYDPEAARQLLAEAGYESGLAFPIAINLTRPGPFAEQIGILLASQLADVGIDATIEVVASSAEFEERKTAGSLTAWLGANTPILPDVWYFWQLEHHSTRAFQNWKGYNNAEFDAALDELRNLPIGPERDAQITAMHQFLMEDVPYAPILAMRILAGAGTGIDPDSVRVYTPYGPIVREIKPSG